MRKESDMNVFDKGCFEVVKLLRIIKFEAEEQRNQTFVVETIEIK